MNLARMPGMAGLWRNMSVDFFEGTNTGSIAILAPIGTLDHQPGVLNAARCFTDAGYDVEVFTIRNTYYPESDLAPAKVRYMPWTLNSARDPRLLVTVMFTFWLFFVLRRRLYSSFCRANSRTDRSMAELHCSPATNHKSAIGAVI